MGYLSADLSARTLLKKGAVLGPGRRGKPCRAPFDVFPLYPKADLCKGQAAPPRWTLPELVGAAEAAHERIEAAVTGRWAEPTLPVACSPHGGACAHPLYVLDNAVNLLLHMREVNFPLRNADDPNLSVRIVAAAERADQDLSLSHADEDLAVAAVGEALLRHRERGLLRRVYLVVAQASVLKQLRRVFSQYRGSEATDVLCDFATRCGRALFDTECRRWAPKSAQARHFRSRVAAIEFRDGLALFREEWRPLLGGGKLDAREHLEFWDGHARVSLEAVLLYAIPAGFVHYMMEGLPRWDLARKLGHKLVPPKATRMLVQLAREALHGAGRKSAVREPIPWDELVGRAGAPCIRRLLTRARGTHLQRFVIFSDVARLAGPEAVKIWWQKTYTRNPHEIPKHLKEIDQHASNPGPIKGCAHMRRIGDNLCPFADGGVATLPDMEDLKPAAPRATPEETCACALGAEPDKRWNPVRATLARYEALNVSATNAP